MARKIIIPVRGDGKGENVLAHAAAIARRIGAHIELVHCRPRPEDLLPFGVPIPRALREQILRSGADVANAEEEKLHEDFRKLMPALGLVETDGPNGGDGLTASWREEEGKQVDVLKTVGRLADLIAVAKPDRDRNLGANTLKSALFHTGRPVLMCPPRDDHPQVLGERIAVAWNGSTEAARAVALTVELMEQAVSVTVLTVGEEEIHGARATDLESYLADRGIAVTLERMTARGSIGETLLRGAAGAGCDLLIMGAYGDSHERETIFGGNTQKVVDTASMPVVLVH